MCEEKWFVRLNGSDPHVSISELTLAAAFKVTDFKMQYANN